MKNEESLSEIFILKNNQNNSDKNVENEIKKINDDSFMFNGKLFKINLKNTNYQKKDKIKRIVYKCANNRKDKVLREKKI